MKGWHRGAAAPSSHPTATTCPSPWQGASPPNHPHVPAAAGAIWQRSLNRCEALAGHSSRLQQDITHTFPARHFPLNY